MTAVREYVRAITSSITSAEATQQKKKEKGKTINFDPKKPKKLAIYVASKFPDWQEKYIDLVREVFDATHLTVDDKKLNPKMAKMGEMKKAMPFVQALKKRLVAGEDPQRIFDRKLAFDEIETLKQMAPGIKKTVGCESVRIILVDVGGKTGRDVLLQDDAAVVKDLPPMAEGAVPGNPNFFFENVDH